MRNLYLTIFLGLMLPALGSACNTESEDNVGTEASTNRLSLSVTLDSPPAKTLELVVFWSVSSGSPDYLYLWGRAPLKGTSFSLDLKSRPPDDALNNYGLGVGMLITMPLESDLVEGVQTDDAFLVQPIGGADRYAIIYVDYQMADEVIEAAQANQSAEEIEKARQHWLYDFPEGYSCGMAKDASPGETFDTFIPVACSQIEIKQGDLSELDFPNWT